MLQQVPAGTLDVALDSKSAEGSFRANRWTNIWWNWHSRVPSNSLKVSLPSYSFEYGKEQFSRQYKTGTTGKDRTSVLKLGLKPAINDVPNLETVEGGSVSLQIGGNRCLPGGTNGSSFFKWFSLACSEIWRSRTPVVCVGKIL